MGNSTRFTEIELQQIRKKLDQRRHSLSQTRDASEEQAEELAGSTINQVSKIDSLDRGLLESATEPTVDLVEHLTAELRAVEAAQRRLLLGSYGTCLGCNKEIPKARLLVAPEAALCGPCQKSYEEDRRTRLHKSQLFR